MEVLHFLLHAEMTKLKGEEFFNVNLDLDPE